MKFEDLKVIPDEGTLSHTEGVLCYISDYEDMVLQEPRQTGIIVGITEDGKYIDAEANSILLWKYAIPCSEIDDGTS